MRIVSDLYTMLAMLNCIAIIPVIPCNSHTRNTPSVSAFQIGATERLGAFSLETP